MAANPKVIHNAPHSTAGRFCTACGAPISEGKRVDECDGCRAYLRRYKKATPRKVMQRRIQVGLWDRRLSLLLPGDASTLDSKSTPQKIQPLSKPHAPSELKKPTKPSLRLVKQR
jgi:predicted nucleic acid-binding Zn ribbon protein